jgi:hypothetical protein
VKKKSHGVETEVPLREFWKGRRLTEGDKTPIADVLGEKITNVLYSTFPPFPDKVVLNPQEWYRMTHGVSSTTIIREQHVDARRIGQVIREQRSGSDSRIESRCRRGRKLHLARC